MFGKLLHRFRNLGRMEQVIVVMGVGVLVLGMILMIRKGDNQVQPEDKYWVGQDDQEIIFPEDVSTDVNSWEEYKSPSGFSVRLPGGGRSITYNTNDFFAYKAGDNSQSEGSEMTEGILVYFKLKKADESDVIENVNNMIKEIEGYDGFKVTSEPKPIEVGSYEAYEFDTVQFGKQRVIIAGKGDSILEIRDYTLDPNKEGYTSVVNIMLKTIVID